MGYHDSCGKDIMSTFGGVQYIGGISSVHQGNIMSTSRDIAIHVEAYYEYTGG